MTDVFDQLDAEHKQIVQMISNLAERYSYSFTRTEAACNELVSRYPFSLLFIVSLCWLGHATLCDELEIILAILVSVEDREYYRRLLSYVKIWR